MGMTCASTGAAGLNVQLGAGGSCRLDKGYVIIWLLPQQMASLGSCPSGQHVSRTLCAQAPAANDQHQDIVIAIRQAPFDYRAKGYLVPEGMVGHLCSSCRTPKREIPAPQTRVADAEAVTLKGPFHQLPCRPPAHFLHISV
jgi:hypothetical protein